jgi:hypothetical protein
MRDDSNDEWKKCKVRGFKTWKVGVGFVPLGTAPLTPFRAFLGVLPVGCFPHY